MTLTRALRKLLQRIGRQLYLSTFTFWQSMGFHIIPNHFYLPIPDTRTLGDDLWRKHSELPGISINESREFDYLSIFMSHFKSEYDGFPRSKTLIPHEYYTDNGSFGSVDGEILYCMVRYFKPALVIEVGSGYSTFLFAKAILKNLEQSGIQGDLVAIEPYPNEVIQAGFPGLSRLMQRRVQDIALAEFQRLKENDILFIDSSHVLRIGGDVQYLYLEVIPRLRKGVIVHVHDVFLPAEYPREWVLRDYRFWTEQYLLQAFMLFNESFEILWAGSHMHLRHPDKLSEAFRSYKPDGNWPCSFWMRRVR